MYRATDLELEKRNEAEHVIKREKLWTRMDKLLLIFGVVVNLGDGVEIYLPGLFNTRIPRSLTGSVNTAKSSKVYDTPCLSRDH